MNFNLLQILLSALAGGGAMFVFNRIARSLDLGSAKDEKTDGKIEKVDSQARASIARVETEQRKVTDELKGAFAASIFDLSMRLARVEETVKHLPSGEQIDKLIDRVSQVEREVAIVGAKMEGTSEMVRTIRDHVMEKEDRR